MNGREVRNGAQVAPDMTGEMSANGVGPANVGWDAAGRRFANEVRSSGAETRGVREQEYNAQRAREIGGLAMGQVLTYNPDPQRTDSVQRNDSVQGADLARETDLVQGADLGAAGPKGYDVAENWPRAVQGRNAGEMRGVAGENLRQLEHLPERMKMQNERVREQAELENGYARNEIAPNLSSVGLASEVERAEYLATDLANAKAEFAPATFEDEIQNKGQEEVGKAMAIRIGKLLKQKSFRPKDVTEERDEGMLLMFERFKDKRVFKGRNG